MSLEIGTGLAAKLKLAILALGAVGVISYIHSAAPQWRANANFLAANATVKKVGWGCSNGDDTLHWCSEAEAARMSGLHSGYYVRFRYADGSGRFREPIWPIEPTGLEIADAKPGATFPILVNPGDTSQAFPAFGRSGLPNIAQTFGIVLFIAGIGWWIRDRRRDEPDAEAFAITALPLAPQTAAPVFGKRAAVPGRAQR